MKKSRKVFLLTGLLKNKQYILRNVQLECTLSSVMIKSQFENTVTQVISKAGTDFELSLICHISFVQTYYNLFPFCIHVSYFAMYKIENNNVYIEA